MDWLLYLAAGAFAGLMSGLLGVGGGTIIVPALSIIFTHQLPLGDNVTMHLASGTALCTMIFTSATSVYTHYKHGSRAWIYFRRMLPFIVIGIVLGALVADFLPSYVMKKTFGVFLLLVALEMQFGRQISRVRLRPSYASQSMVSVVIGGISSMLGIGGGTLMMPYLSRCRVTLRKITSIAAICSLTVGVIGTIAVIITGFNDTLALPWATGYVYWPAVLCVGLPSILLAKISAAKVYSVPIKHLKIGFTVFLLIIGIKMVL